MKRQSLYIGGALLATTALSTSAYAGTFVNPTATATGIATTLTAAALSAQVFPATGAENVSVGPAATTINFTNSLTTTFDVEIESSASDFTGTITAAPGTAEGATATTITDLSANSFSGCTVQVLTERILIEDCLGTSTAIDALRVSGLSFNEANGLAVAGSSIALSGIVRGQSNNTFELLTSANVITSANGFSTAITAGTTATINNTASPAFSTIGAATALSLGAVKTTTVAVVGTNLTQVVNTEAEATAEMEFTVTHGVLTDAATAALDIAGGLATSAVPSAFNGNVASFDFDAGEIIGSWDIEVNFDGTTAIQAWAAGTIDVAFTPGTVNLSAPPSATGGLGALTRGGFSTQINTAQSSAGNGADLFQSLIRVVNNGTVAGTVTLAVRDDSDGSLYGNFTSESIEPNSSIQISMPSIETALGITAAGQYQIGISGSISGYAQHVMFNSVDNLFVDLSGFRNSNP